MTERSVIHATFSIERTYDAAPSKVFRAYADRAIKRRWFVEGEGWDIETYDLDFRIGGTESSSFRFKGGALIRFDAVYQDIVPNDRIIVAYNMTIDDKRISASLATTELKPDGKRTKLVFTEQGAYLDGYDSIAQREEGTRELHEALARELARS
ncbi:SRPBCC family protein [Hyphomicrobium sp.]|uniref:SRPBCC family protein n=1 Tax=Hyphomicrobium sp. TaxID=82 RepID=UPI0025C2FE18|nr:SRPBCC family protein [Hyphomicrobium sp.]MCC7250651.1 SRPBCC family protein [Hyphomicrobium sp.]